MSYFNTELFIARRIFSLRGTSGRFSQSIVSFAVFGIALGLFVMILSVAIVTGFKKEVRNKVIGFGSHVQIVNYDSNLSYETVPVCRKQPWLESVRNLNGVKSVQSFATKPGMIKTDTENHGIVLKGVGSDFDWTFFRQNLVDGKLFSVNDSVKTDQVLISKMVASMLKIKVGDPIYSYFLNTDSRGPKMRKFVVCGIYQTSLEEFDQLFVLADIGHVQRINDWRNDQIGGYEVNLTDFDRLDPITKQIRDLTISYSEDEQMMLRPIAITAKYPQIFDWLNLLDLNVWIILVLIILVAGFNMVSGLLILILERTTMIGTLKAMGYASVSVRKIFIYLSSMLIIKGMIWGNVLGVAFCIIQHSFGVVKLDPTAYYLDTVPINLNPIHWVLLNVGTLLITIAMLLIPSWYIARIEPDKAIRFD